MRKHIITATEKNIYFINETLSGSIIIRSNVGYFSHICSKLHLTLHSYDSFPIDKCITSVR